MIDIVGKFRIEVALHVIRQRGEMHDRVKTIEILLCQVAHVLRDFRNLGCRFSKVATGEEIRVEPNHFMTGGTQYRRRYSTDIAFMAGQKYSHLDPPRI